MRNYGGCLKLESFSNVGSSLLPDVKEEIARLRKVGDYSQKALEKCDISKIFRAHTGMNIILYINSDVSYNAFARYAPIDANHPFFKGRGLNASWFDDISVDRISKNPVEGTVDRKRYKVDGVFKEIECVIVVAEDLIKDRHYTDGEIAEIILHEAGHHFTFFEYLGHAIRDSFVISNVSRSIVSSEDIEVRRKRLVRAKDQLGIERLNYDDLLQESPFTRKESTELVLISRTLFVNDNQTTTPYYDYRCCEQLADAFVSYHGGGYDIASALNKLRKQGGFDIATRNPIMYMAIELMKVMFSLLVLLASPLVFILLMINLAPQVGKYYDDPLDRVRSLENNLINALRQLDSKAKTEREIIHDQLKALEGIKAEMNDRKTVYELIYRVLSPLGRKQYDEEKHQKEIQALVFNKLQAKAQLLRGKQ